MAEPNAPNDAFDRDPAEGSRDAVNLDVDQEARYDDAKPEKDEGGGITNRPLREEIGKQRDLPPRGETKHGGHAS